jgi:chloramphenicol O-acetyltransferase type A
MTNYKVLDIDVDDLPFNDFLTSRYSMTVRVNAEETYNLSKNEDISFFNLDSMINIIARHNQLCQL